MRLLGAACLLGLYAVAATPLAPALVALLAAFDGGHQVAVRQEDHRLQVVLRHDCPHSPTHRHGIVARALTVFAQRTTDTQPDHVLQFGTTDTSQQAPTLALALVANSSAPDPAVAHDVAVRTPELIPQLAAHPRPPPDASALLLTVRSTVLVL